VLQFIFVVNVLQSVFFLFFYQFKWGGASPVPIPHLLEKFLLKKENDNVCELNEIASELPMQKRGTFIAFFDNGNE